MKTKIKKIRASKIWKMVEQWAKDNGKRWVPTYGVEGVAAA